MNSTVQTGCVSCVSQVSLSEPQEIKFWFFSKYVLIEIFRKECFFFLLNYCSLLSSCYNKESNTSDINSN